MSDEIVHLCPKYEKAIEILGKKWTGKILRVLCNGPTSFSKIARSVSDLSDRVLSERLKDLESHGIVERRVTPSMPVKIEYGLTAKGCDLQEVLDALQRWADRWEGCGEQAEDEQPRAQDTFLQV